MQMDNSELPEPPVVVQEPVEKKETITIPKPSFAFIEMPVESFKCSDLSDIENLLKTCKKAVINITEYLNQRDKGTKLEAAANEEYKNTSAYLRKQLMQVLLGMFLHGVNDKMNLWTAVDDIMKGSKYLTNALSTANAVSLDQIQYLPKTLDNLALVRLQVFLSHVINSRYLQYVIQYIPTQPEAIQKHYSKASLFADKSKMKKLDSYITAIAKVPFKLDVSNIHFCEYLADVHDP
jgi:hypothetical protein